MTLTHEATFEVHGDKCSVWCQCGWPDDKPAIEGDRAYCVTAWDAHVDMTSYDVGAMAVVAWIMAGVFGTALGVAIGFGIDRLLGQGKP